MVIKADDFLEAVRAGGFVADDLLAAYVDAYPASTDATVIAKQLVKAGHLTSFQAKYLYSGKGSSLRLGPYLVLELLGKGGMGYVYKAEHRRMRRVVALKVISKTALASPEAVRRFEREVQAAALLEHPNIVTAFDAGEHAGTHYLVMQFVAGPTLFQLVRNQGPLSIERAVDYVCQVARGLSYAHSKGVVHRDIKPGNLLLDRDGHVKILDMGLARLNSTDSEQEQLTGSGQIMGTVDYMAPEQAVDTRQADPRADIYSLGATLWFLLTGRPLFGGDTPIKRLMAHLKTPAPSLLAERHDASEDLSKIFRRMVEKSLDDRYQAMTDVLEAFRGLPRGGTTPDPRRLPAGSASHILQLADQPTRTARQAASELGDEQTVDLHGLDIDTHRAGTVTAPTRRRSSRRKLQANSLRSTVLGSILGITILSVLTTVLVRQIDPSPPRPLTPALATAPEQSSQPLRSAPLRDSQPSRATPPFGASTAQEMQSAWSEHSNTPVCWTNSIGLALVLIPPGEFSLVEREQAAKVTISRPFRLGQTTVTQAQWRLVMGTEPWKGGAYVRETAETPATHISCDDAVAFCLQLTAMEREAGVITASQEYGLPTEVQWEYACRAGTTTTWSFGEDGAAMDDYGWYGKVWSDALGKAVPGGNVGTDLYPRPVGLKLPNPWGLFDMHGNVWEVCASQFDVDPAVNGMAETPVYRGYQVLRGGDCEEEVGGCRSAIRAAIDYFKPMWDVGFRVVLTPP